MTTALWPCKHELAIMVGLASVWPKALHIDVGQINALNGGLHLAFKGTILVSIVAAIISLVSIKNPSLEKRSSVRHRSNVVISLTDMR